MYPGNQVTYDKLNQVQIIFMIPKKLYEFSSFNFKQIFAAQQKMEQIDVSESLNEKVQILLSD